MTTRTSASLPSSTVRGFGFRWHDAIAAAIADARRRLSRIGTLELPNSRPRPYYASRDDGLGLESSRMRREMYRL